MTTSIEEIVTDYLRQCGLALDKGAVLSTDVRDVHLGNIEAKGDAVLLHMGVTVQIKQREFMEASGKWGRERIK